MTSIQIVVIARSVSDEAIQGPSSVWIALMSRCQAFLHAHGFSLQWCAGGIDLMIVQREERSPETSVNRL